MIITLIGFMGCGKSSVGRDLSSLLAWKFVDLDEEIVRRHKRTIPQLFESGEACFREAEFETLSALLDRLQGENAIIALGGGSFSDERTRKAALSNTVSVFLKTGREEIRRRLGGSDSTRPLYKDMDELFDARTEFYQQSLLTVNTDGKSISQIAVEVKNLISRLRP